jgi:hypothetical protein
VFPCKMIFCQDRLGTKVRKSDRESFLSQAALEPTGAVLPFYIAAALMNAVVRSTWSD